MASGYYKNSPCSEWQALVSYCEEREWCKRLISFVAMLYGDDDHHGLDHVLRVTCWSFILASRVRADIDVVVASALLHDIGRSGEWRGVHHAKASSLIASIVLRSLGFPAEKVENVVKAILAHSYSLGFEKTSLEECVVSDADKLDALGAIGVYRAIAYGVDKKRGIEGTLKHYHEKLKKLYGTLCLEVSKEIGKSLAKALEKYFEQLSSEVEGLTELRQRVLNIARETGSRIGTA